VEYIRSIQIYTEHAGILLFNSKFNIHVQQQPHSLLHVSSSCIV